jgi:hypothetical protein
MGRTKSAWHVRDEAASTVDGSPSVLFFARCVLGLDAHLYLASAPSPLLCPNSPFSEFTTDVRCQSRGNAIGSRYRRRTAVIQPDRLRVDVSPLRAFADYHRRLQCVTLC